MFRILPTVFLILISTSIVNCQRGVKVEKPIYHLTTSLNYYEGLSKYNYFTELSWNDRDLILTFLTPVSGTFVIENETELDFLASYNNVFPTQQLSLGFGFQVTYKKWFHEFTVSRVSYSKTEKVTNYRFDLNNGEPPEEYTGGDDFTIFSFGLRYETGKLFNVQNDKTVNFGIGLLIDQSFHSFDRKEFASNEFGVGGTLYEIEMGLVPRLHFKVDKRLSYEVKLIPSFLIISASSIKTLNPNVDLNRQRLVKENENGDAEFRVGGSIGLKYRINDIESGRRRRGK